jgi:hypothetical protein
MTAYRTNGGTLVPLELMRHSQPVLYSPSAQFRLERIPRGLPIMSVILWRVLFAEVVTEIVTGQRGNSRNRTGRAPDPSRDLSLIGGLIWKETVLDGKPQLGFQDRCLKPLGHPSVAATSII